MQARYAPPASDLAIFVAYCTDRALQQRHWDELVRLHWEAMAAALRRAGCDPDQVGGSDEGGRGRQYSRKFAIGCSQRERRCPWLAMDTLGFEVLCWKL